MVRAQELSRLEFCDYDSEVIQRVDVDVDVDEQEARLAVSLLRN